MLAMQCSRLGRPEVLAATEVTDPQPGSGEVLIEVTAAGVNFPDALLVAGTYQSKPPLPFIPGSEVAGRIVAVADDLDAAEADRGIAVGARVAAFTGLGGYGQQVAVPAARVYPLPDGVTDIQGAVLPVAHGTAYHGLVDQAQLRSGETVLVLGASGGTGLAAVQIAARVGARVIAAASSAERLALAAEHGAADGIDYTQADLAASLKELTGGKGVDVVYDPVGGAAADAAIRRLAWHGRYLTVGYASGPIPSAPMNRLLLTEGSLTGVLWGAWAKRNPGADQQNFAQLAAWVAEGSIRPHIGAVHDLTDAAAALTAVRDRRASGKVVLTSKEIAA